MNTRLLNKLKKYTLDVFKSDAGCNHYSISCNGKPVLTPLKKNISLPFKSIAEELLKEFESSSQYSADTISFQKLIYTAIDHFNGADTKLFKELIGYASTDLILYHQGSPDDLHKKEINYWQSIINWVNDKFSTQFKVHYTLFYEAQDEDSLLKLQKVIENLTAFELSGLYQTTQITGSLFLSLAFLFQKIKAEDLFLYSQLHENFQAEKWGKIDEIQNKQKKLKTEILQLDRFFSMIKKKSYV